MNKKIYKLITCTFLMFLPFSPAFALLDIQLTKWANNALPVAVVPFSGQEQIAAAPNAGNISSVVTNDLKNSGRFKLLESSRMTQFPSNASAVDYKYWRGLGMDDVVVGNVQAVGGGNYKVSFSLVNTFGAGQANSNVLLSQDFTVNASQLRSVGHHISDLIYAKLLGIRGIFSTHIAYVVVDRVNSRAPKYILEVADADGYNPRPLLTSPQPIMSPAWSPDGKDLAYVSFENQKPQIYIHNIASGSRHVVTSFSGINGAPAWSPNGRELAVVLSRTGHPKINIVDIGSGNIRQVTNGFSIDTEPTWSPDGSSIAFTSDRGGQPQIYQLNVASGKIQRLTYDGSYNTRAAFSADGKSIIMLHRDENGSFDIASQDLSSGVLSLLTRAGIDDSPSISPNGKMVLYTSTVGRTISLGIVSTDGNVKLRLPVPEGDVQSPAWSPFA